MAYGEFFGGDTPQERNALFVNLSRGIGLGVMIDGKLYYGNSGFAGEFGHIPFYENETLCHCGKRGCLETEASGIALERAVEKLLSEGKSSLLAKKVAEGERIKLEDIVYAAKHEDILSIEQIEVVGEKVGKAIALLINLFNPELVVVGGAISTVGEYVMLPIRSAINKYSLTLVSKDTAIRASKLGDKAGVIGACMLVRSRLIDTL
jgi:predicted NBD/HSP70 family sugar kinase